MLQGQNLNFAIAGNSILDLAVLDRTGDGKPEIAVATEGGMVRLVGADGEILGTMRAGADVAKIVAVDSGDNSSPQIVAGSDDDGGAVPRAKPARASRVVRVAMGQDDAAEAGGPLRYVVTARKVY